MNYWIYPLYNRLSTNLAKWNTLPPMKKSHAARIHYSAEFSHSVVSDSLQPHGLQHARLPCPSLSPRICSNSCPSSQWCYLTISSSAALFSFCLWSFPASGSIPLSRLFASGGQSIGALFSASVLQLSILLISFRTDWFDLPVVQGIQESSPIP